MDLYFEASLIIKKVNSKRGSIKNLVFNSKASNKKALYALVCETIKHKETLADLGSRCVAFGKEKMLQQNDELIYVLLYEHFVGRGVRGRYKTVILRNKTALHAVCQRLKIEAGLTDIKQLFKQNAKLEKKLPKYVRVNTLKMSVEEVLGKLTEDKFKVDTCSGQSFQTKLDNLGEDNVLADPFMPNLLAFHPQTDLHTHPLYRSGALILQDKASCVPAYVLSPLPGSHVIDCCAAPGNKTTHLAALMNDTGKVFAFDRDTHRVKTLQAMVNRTGATCITVQCRDFLTVDPSDPLYAEVGYILVDPSCSGSGMLGRNVSEEVDQHEAERLQQLSAFQTTILLHALSFPSIHKVVYSTCSVHSVENENVVERVLSKMRHKFDLECVLPDWPCRGLSLFPCGEKCLRLSPETTRTNGFFVACFVRRDNTVSAGSTNTSRHVNGQLYEKPRTVSNNKWIIEDVTYKHLNLKHNDIDRTVKSTAQWTVSCVEDFH